MSDYYDQPMRERAARPREIIPFEQVRDAALSPPWPAGYAPPQNEDPDLAEAAVTADECRISRILGLRPCPEDHALTLIRSCPVCRAAL